MRKLLVLILLFGLLVGCSAPEAIDEGEDEDEAAEVEESAEDNEEEEDAEAVEATDEATDEPEREDSRSDPSTAEASVQALLDAAIDPTGPAVAVYVSSPDTGSFTVTQGSADIEAGTPVGSDSRFRLASVSKTFLAATVLRLVEEGYFGLDDPIINWLPDDMLTHYEGGDVATIRQLLQMTTGFPDYLATDEFWAEVEADPTRWWTPADALVYGYDWPSSFAPGEGYEYSNTNYLMLQIIAEDATGESYASLIDTYISQPLGLENTYAETAEQSDTVHAYYPEDDGTWGDITTYNDGFGLGDGGVISTPAEVGTFIHALMNGKLLSEESFAEMSNLIDDGEGGQYGLGLSTYETDWGTAYGHSGVASGFSSEMWYVPDYDITVVLLFASEDLSSEHSTLIDDVLNAVLGG